MSDWSAFIAAFDAIPYGCHRASFDGRTYNVRKISFVAGRAEKLVAEELGGRDYVSLNLYRLPSGPLLKPCEMSVHKVVGFVLGCTLEPK